MGRVEASFPHMLPRFTFVDISYDEIEARKSKHSTSHKKRRIAARVRRVVWSKIAKVNIKRYKTYIQTVCVHLQWGLPNLDFLEEDFFLFWQKIQFGSHGGARSRTAIKNVTNERKSGRFFLLDLCFKLLMLSVNASLCPV